MLALLPTSEAALATCSDALAAACADCAGTLGASTCACSCSLSQVEGVIIGLVVFPTLLLFMLMV